MNLFLKTILMNSFLDWHLFGSCLIFTLYIVHSASSLIMCFCNTDFPSLIIAWTLHASKVDMYICFILSKTMVLYLNLCWIQHGLCSVEPFNWCFVTFIPFTTLQFFSESLKDKYNNKRKMNENDLPIKYSKW